jgi:hypothetical protein
VVAKDRSGGREEQGQERRKEKIEKIETKGLEGWGGQTARFWTAVSKKQ